MGLLDALGGQQSQGANASPIMTALVGLLAYEATKNGAAPSTGAPQSGNPGLPGILGSLFSGTQNGGALSTGLQGLFDQFSQAGLGDKARTWISNGSNEPIAPQQVGQALGEDRLQWLTQQTGMSRDQLLSGLSAKLPQFIDKLTPNGRIPTEQEAAQIIK